MGGIYYWFPKITGRLLSEKLGQWHFWLMFIGMNVTFGPMHLVGIDGMPRRIYTYDESMGWEFLNQLETVGAFIIAASVAIFLVNFFKSVRSGEVAGDDPGTAARWSGRSRRRRRSTTSRAFRWCTATSRSGTRSIPS